MKNISDRRCRGTGNTFYVQKLFRKSCLLWDNVEKWFRAGQTTGDNMAHVRFMLVTYGCKYTLWLSNTYCFITASMVASPPKSPISMVQCMPYVSTRWLFVDNLTLKMKVLHPSKCQKIFTQYHSVIFNKAAVRIEVSQSRILPNFTFLPAALKFVRSSLS